MSKIKFEKYEIHYLDRQNRPQVYRSNWSLCIDGAEEAFALDVKRNCKDIISVTRIN